MAWFQPQAPFFGLSGWPPHFCSGMPQSLQSSINAGYTCFPFKSRSTASFGTSAFAAAWITLPSFTSRTPFAITVSASTCRLQLLNAQRVCLGSGAPFTGKVD
ncbi:UNKNOWN [Stylonychia lemnae]|uniref:Uncharacterized protein n=1 Tax=Stylonychia lemnae TaxID=5949 RepID=A0A078A0E6_STYLE|nr:UNKNOWN [Stylonychia lemnae]|eukprot:CDW74918.1 UNKNOWN [Stylonychia lemnae]